MASKNNAWIAAACSIAVTLAVLVAGCAQEPGQAAPSNAEALGTVEGAALPAELAPGGKLPIPIKLCKTNAQCGAKQFCWHRPGHCDGFGICAPIPDACTMQYDPVCGCNGKTYSNACHAYMEGVSVAHAGECKPAKCFSNADCPDGTFCDRPCSDVAAAGQCMPKPTACPRIWAPVCGCDGKTYPNDCERRAAGVGLDHKGICQKGCTSNADCKAGFYCKKKPGDCNGKGVCAQKPKVCIEIYEPVCGCDGKTYGNACVAAAAGVDIAHKGQCECPQILCKAPMVPVDTDGDGCDDACKLPCQDVCDCYAASPKPPIPCPLCAPIDAAPDNICGGPHWECVNGLCQGACGPLPIDVKKCFGCVDNTDCAANEFCAKKPGNCDGIGMCTPRPDVCPDVWMPVCGCDGNTYGNACEAAVAGVNVEHDGPCVCPVIDCAPGLVPIDTDGDGCDDKCVCGIIIDCAPGWHPVDTNGDGCDDQCEPDAKCETACDCVDQLGLPSPIACKKGTASWACDAGVCKPVCAAAPPLCPVSCKTNADCPDTAFCFKKPGNCDGPGICLPRPKVCPLSDATKNAILDQASALTNATVTSADLGAIMPAEPVCGCDGKTYLSACEAYQAGTTIAHKGACECPNILCAPGQEPVDTDGDGCADTCKTPCDSYCDCYAATGGPPDGFCPLLCVNCGMFWGCDAGYCEPHCGFMPDLTKCNDNTCKTDADCCKGGVCPADVYCAKAPGNCDGEGVCKTIPQNVGCIDLWDPVCGCDGKTYSNGCFASLAGVNIAHKGACCDPIVCPKGQKPVDTDGDGCADDCQCPVQILCKPGSEPVDTDGDGCPDDCVTKCETPCDCYDQLGAPPDVCGPMLCGPLGCKSYWTCQNNLCEAVCAPKPPQPIECIPCKTNADCAIGEYCQKNPGQCDGPGVCLPIPPPDVPCIQVTVCGCDGKTYPTPCDAAQAGVSIDHYGACKPICPIVIDCLPGYHPVDTDGDGCNDACEPTSGGCHTNADCSPSDYCAKDNATGADVCSDALAGTCKPRPTICPLYYAPVCGCDGATYGNPCEAAAAGTNVAHDGVCAVVCMPLVCPAPKVPTDTDGDGCNDQCVCPNLVCASDQVAVDTDGDGCNDQCQCQKLKCPVGTVPTDVDGNGCDDTCLPSLGSICYSNADCAASEFCAKAPLNGMDPCSPKTPGECVARPKICPMVLAPVCGCDGKSYNNSCEASAAGVNVDPDGSSCGSGPLPIVQ